MLLDLVKFEVAGTYIADSALVEGAICDTMDLRRSVILINVINEAGGR